MEVAAGRRVDRARHVTGQDHPAAPPRPRLRDRHRGEERLGVRVQRHLEQARLVGDLHDAAEVHHRHPVADVLDHREIVGDEQEGELQLVLQVHEQVDDLRLDGDVERGHRLVADDELRVEREGPRDPDPLALPPGELVGIRTQVPAAEADPLEQRLHPLLPFAAARGEVVDEHGLPDDRPRRHPRVEGGVGVLEDHLHPLAEGHHADRVEVGHVFAVHVDPPLGRLQQLEHGASDRGLAAARLADEAQRLAAPDVERHPVHRPHLAGDPREDALSDREELPQPADLQERRRLAGWRRAGRGRGSAWGRGSGRGVHASPPSRRSACQQATRWPGRCSRSGG